MSVFLAIIGAALLATGIPWWLYYSPSSERPASLLVAFGAAFCLLATEPWNWTFQGIVYEISFWGSAAVLIACIMALLSSRSSKGVG